MKILSVLWVCDVNQRYEPLLAFPAPTIYMSCILVV